MEKNQKSNYAEQEALRQFGVFNTPIPARSLDREER